MFRGCLLALVLLSVEPSLGAQKLWSLQGRVLDQEGHPVVGASVATNWGANGVTLEQLHRFEKDDKIHPETAMNERRPVGTLGHLSSPDGRERQLFDPASLVKRLQVDGRR